MFFVGLLGVLLLELLMLKLLDFDIDFFEFLFQLELSQEFGLLNLGNTTLKLGYLH